MINYIYLLKVILCSAVLLGYYYLALRNKVFHQYNRIYLNCCVILSWIIPLLSFSYIIEQESINKSIYNVIDFASQNNNYFIQNSSERIDNAEQNIFSYHSFFLIVFIIISVYFLLALIASFIKIIKLKSKYTAHKLSECTIYLTDEKYTPYSFLKLIFWNKKIDIESKLGKQILQHELVHVEQQHSLDKIFIQLNLIVGWFNPFFWIVKKELEMIHEFIADEKSIPNGDSSEFANMILSIAHINKNVALTNPFFFSPIKRRLNMLLHKKSIKYSYLQRVFALPILICLVFILSFKTKQGFAQVQKILPVFNNRTIVNTSTISNNNESIEKVKTNKKKETIQNTLIETKQDTHKVAAIDDLQKEYQILEKQYKYDAAIASARKNLMKLIKKQNLTDEQMVQLFQATLKLDEVSLNVDELKKKETNIKEEYEKILGTQGFKKFWEQRTQLKIDLNNYLNN